MKPGFKHKTAISLLNMISRTWRVEARGKIPQKPAIVIFWHGLMLPAWKYFEGREPVAVVSRSKDGEILSRLLLKWGFTLIRGSSSKGGKEVLESVCEETRENIVLMTPDGPRGPAKKMKAGAAVASQRTGVSIYPCRVDIKSKKIFEKSWDNFELPLPFSIIILNFLNPVLIPEESTREEINNYMIELQEKLTGNDS